MPAERLWIWYLPHTAYPIMTSSTHRQRVWSEKTKAIGLGKQYCSTFTCTSRRNDGFERKGACTIAYYCPSQGASRAACQIPMGASYRSQLLPLHPGSPNSQGSVLPCEWQGPRKQPGAVTLLATECCSSFPIYSSSSGLYLSQLSLRILRWYRRSKQLTQAY